MSNVIQLNVAARKSQALREKACQWVVRLSAGASDRELQDLHAWLDQSPEHVEALLEVASMWDQVSVLSELAEVFPLEEYLAPRQERSGRGLLYSALAALVLVFVLQGPLLNWLKAARDGFGPEALLLSYETRIGQQSTVVLPDGSEVLLNTNSRIDIAFSAASRDIILHRGEGHFTVAKNKNRPFRVYANGGVVEAVGTAFTVQQLQQQSLEVTVLEGEVSFTRTPPAVATDLIPQSLPEEKAPAAQAPPQEPVVVATAASPLIVPPPQPISLTAGESLRIDESDTAVQKQTFAPAELESRLAWRNGMLLFQGDRLEAVIGELSRYTAIRIDVDAAVRDIEVLGVYRAVDIESTLQAMSITFNLEVERISPEHIVLKAAN